MNFKYTILIPIIILLSSCQEKLLEAEVPGKGVLVPLSVSTSSISSSSVIPAEEGAKDAITSLHILVFSGSGANPGSSNLVYTAKAITKQDGTFAATFAKSLDEDDVYRLVVLANADERKIVQLSRGKTYHQISQALYDDARQRFSSSNPVLMFGLVNHGNGILIEESMSLGTIKLIRAVARIDVGVGRYNADTGKWDLASSSKLFRLTDIEAWSPMNRSFYMPVWENMICEADGTPLANRASGNLDYSATISTKWKYDNADILTNSSATYCKDVIYLPETPLEGYTANQPENRNKRTTLIIGGYLHDSANPAETETKTWYRVDFTTATGNTPDGPLFDLLRNHLYRISLSVSRLGAANPADAWSTPLPPGQIIVEMAPWEEGGSIDTPIADPTINIDADHSTLPEGVSINARDFRVDVSAQNSAEMLLAFSAASPVELTPADNPYERIQIRKGIEEEVNGKILTYYQIEVPAQISGQLAYTGKFAVKTPLQHFAYHQLNINVQASGKVLPTVTLGGQTWMAFNSMGKGNECQIYLDGNATVEEMYRTHWTESLGRFFQFRKKTPFVPWKRPRSQSIPGTASWSSEPGNVPCPEGYRLPTFKELAALFPANTQVATSRPATYQYNGESITAELKKGEPEEFLFDGSGDRGYARYISIKSNTTKAVLYIPLGGWKEAGSTATNPGTDAGTHLWGNEYGVAAQINKVREGYKFTTNYDYGVYNKIGAFQYVRCIKNK